MLRIFLKEVGGVTTELAVRTGHDAFLIIFGGVCRWAFEVDERRFFGVDFNLD